MINLGILGCGDVAFRTYLPGLAPLADRARLVACCDPQLDRAERLAAGRRAQGSPTAAAELGAYADLADFLAHPGLDAVLNLTPAPFHRDTTAAALDAGLHVFSEKPIAADVDQARALIDLARDRDRLLLCAPAVLATARFRWLRELVAAGRLGRPTLATGQMANMGPAAWRDYRGDPAVFYSPAVGPLLDTGVYVLHAITGLLGPARRVEAFGGVAIPRRRVLIPDRYGEMIDVGANDHMLLHLDFGDNAFAQVLSSFAVPRTRVPAFELHGTDGTVSIAQDAWYDVDAPIDIYIRDQRLGAVERWQREAPPAAPSGPIDHLIQAGPAHFVACLEGSEAPLLTAEHATHVLEIILTAARSAAEGRALDLETEF